MTRDELHKFVQEMEWRRWRDEPGGMDRPNQGRNAWDRAWAASIEAVAAISEFIKLAEEAGDLGLVLALTYDTVKETGEGHYFIYIEEWADHGGEYPAKIPRQSISAPDLSTTVEDARNALAVLVRELDLRPRTTT